MQSEQLQVYNEMAVSLQKKKDNKSWKQTLAAPLSLLYGGVVSAP